MAAPIHTIVETAAFTGQLNKLGVSEEERAAIYDTYSADPEYGKVVKRTGGLRKGRVGKDDTGKSGGYRVFSFFANDQHPTFLLWIIDKTKDENLTDAQEKTFKTLTSNLKKECK
ncbi:type II toxin-antitoxin system RelE/ParE family toxin [uncultured Sphingomonas sp.]|uniref:type II toxin-antitoxin system RelE/ParE family toxin n=1 Tax=uncultured Sphingomonas sp. TaxID=158754 RepID=UPI0025919F7F|nr:type II toxin-antitoxin system RelE/ParE family toxin [uncultured Sphingomonas sp.]